MRQTQPATLDSAFAAVSALAQDFAAHEAKYLAPGYQEAEVRKDFLDKFLTALGWDVNHDHQKNPYEQEVKVELGQQQGLARKRADYAFSLAPNFKQPRFFVEAKKPSLALANSDDYFQAIRYGFSAQTPLAVLTDFEEFHILDSRYKAAPATALSRLVPDGAFHYRDYLDPEKFARIYWLFSREAVANGSLEKFAADLPKPRRGAKQLALFPGGDKPFDEAFLEELDEHRLALAKAFKKSDESLDSETLTEITQRTLDRLVFIRFLEDRLIEANAIISHLGEKASAWADFQAQRERLDRIYNGIVFKKHPLLDSPAFAPDENAFAGICEALSHRNSAYDFSTVPIHILGSIYERFLGNVIRATPKRAEIEQKPEVRKAGGVYYTPDYIVRYIVEETVGKLIEGRNPKAIAQMHFADIACGSGSFLLGIYECLLSYHAAYYNKFPKEATQADCLTHDDGSLHLTLKKRRDILLNNIFGVDIDAQAVEVAQLSLYLRLLQDETASSAHQYRMDFEQQVILPSLAANIKCGNSLIGSDILHGQFEFTQEEEKKLNPMDFEASFPTIFPRFSPAARVAETPEFDEIVEGGLIHGPSEPGESAKYSEKKIPSRPRLKGVGFDAIVGNPPYLGGREWKEEGGRKYGYLVEAYETAEYQFDVYSLFIERAIKLTKQGGLIGYITPNTWLNNRSNTKLRRYLLANTAIRSLTDYAAVKVFDQVIVLPVVAIFQRGKSDSVPVSLRRPLPGGTPLEVSSLDQEFWNDGDLSIFNIAAKPGEQTLRAKLELAGTPLDNLAEVKFGIKIYETGKGTPRQTPRAAKERIFEADHQVDASYRPYLEGKDVQTYQLTWKDRWLKYGKNLAAPRNQLLFEGLRILVRRIVGGRLIATQTDESFVTSQLLQIVKPLDSGACPTILAILNSRLIAFYFRTKYNRTEKTFPEIRIYELAGLPIFRIDRITTEDRQKCDRMARLVNFMLEAKTHLAAAKTEKDTTYYEGKCAALDQEIDALVYDLYGLTPEEIALVESGSK